LLAHPGQGQNQNLTKPLILGSAGNARATQNQGFSEVLVLSLRQNQFADSFLEIVAMLWREFCEVWVMEQQRSQIQPIRQWVLVGMGMVLLASGCATTDTPQAEDAGDRPTEQQAVTATPPTVEPAGEEVDDPDAQAPTGNLPEGLIRETTLEQLPQVPTGRTDPFGAVATRPVSIRPRPATPETAALGGVPAPTTVQTSATGIPLPAPSAVVPVAAPAAPSTVAVPAAAPAPAPVVPQRLSNQIRISGVIQIGDQVSVIVEVPNEGTSRPVQVGEDIISGRVRLARIDGGDTAQPQVVLLEDGVETVKTVSN
jgi:hypothetical protein